MEGWGDREMAVKVFPASCELEGFSSPPFGGRGSEESETLAEL